MIIQEENGPDQFRTLGFFSECLPWRKEFGPLAIKLLQVKLEDIAMFYKKIDNPDSQVCHSHQQWCAILWCYASSCITPNSNCTRTRPCFLLAFEYVEFLHNFGHMKERDRTQCEIRESSIVPFMQLVQYLFYNLWVLLASVSHWQLDRHKWTMPRETKDALCQRLKLAVPQ